MIKLELKIAILLFVAVAVLVYLNSFNITMEKTAEEKEFTNVRMGGTEVLAEISDTPEKRTLGLSGREKLSENEGMLFVFEEPAIRNFWMKGMNFPIDIIWLDENKIVVDITKNALPESYPARFSPSSPAQYVLEVNAGFADRHNMKVGDKINF